MTHRPDQLQLEVIYYHPSELRLDPGNPRNHDKAHIKQLAKSMKAFDFNAPILIDQNRVVIAGHGRKQAAELLGMTAVPTICLGHLSEDQRKAYMVADNRLCDLSNWNEGALKDIMISLAEAELSFDLDAVGFSITEIDLMDPEVQVLAGADELPPPGPVMARPGDRWVLGKHAIVCGSALEQSDFQTLMGKLRANVIITDPPYNVPIAGNVSGHGKISHGDFAQACGEMSETEFIAFLERGLGNAVRFSREGSLHYVAMDWRHYFELTVAARAIYTEHINLCIWAKTNAGMGSFYRSQYELFDVWRHGKASHRNNVQLGTNGRARSNVWQYPGANNIGRKSEEGNLLALHPTVKPVALIADILLDCTKRGDILLDPFLGSGSSIIAAEKVGRRCYGIELEPRYVDVAVRRWQRWTGEQAVRHDGVLFDDVVPVLLEG